MEVTTVSHAGIANRIKNILSAMAQYDKVNTLYDTINYIFPSIPKVDNAVNTFPEDWRLHVDSKEEQYIENYKTIEGFLSGKANNFGKQIKFENHFLFEHF